MADLRSAAVDFKRDNTSKAKWAHGESYGPGRAKDGHAAPARQKPRYRKGNAAAMTDVRGGDALTANAPTRPAAAEATPMAPRSRSMVRRGPGKDASVAPVWMTTSTAMTSAVGSSSSAAPGDRAAKSRSGGARSGR